MWLPRPLPRIPCSIQMYFTIQTSGKNLSSASLQHLRNSEKNHIKTLNQTFLIPPEFLTPILLLFWISHLMLVLRSFSFTTAQICIMRNRMFGRFCSTNLEFGQTRLESSEIFLLFARGLPGCAYSALHCPSQCTRTNSFPCQFGTREDCRVRERYQDQSSGEQSRKPQNQRDGVCS